MPIEREQTNLIDHSAQSDPLSVSVVIPCLNEYGQIEAVIDNVESALAGLDYHLVIVDGGSTDGTVGVIEKRLNDRINIKKLSEAGRSFQMRSGAEVARGDIILFLHADTRLPPQTSEALTEFRASTKCWGFFKVMLDHPGLRYRLVSFMINLRSSLSSISTGDQCQFVTREEYFRIGGFPEQDLMEDVELSKRLKRVSTPFVIDHRAKTSARRWESVGYLKTILLMWSLRFRYWRGESPKDLHKRYYRY